jgi:hypothetical protein
LNGFPWQNVHTSAQVAQYTNLIVFDTEIKSRYLVLSFWVVNNWFLKKTIKFALLRKKFIPINANTILLLKPSQLGLFDLGQRTFGPQILAVVLR